MTTENAPYYLLEPCAKRVPFVLSIPHCGVEFPVELADKYVPEQLKILDDTDWYLDKLYDFAPSLGITTIYAKYSRWVIDLNREPNSAPLYDDGRLTTALCPTTTFLNESLYIDKEFEPNEIEQQRRLEAYYYPYHGKIDEIVSDLCLEFGQVIFWDAHSIRRVVKTIQEDPLPDLILGDNEGKTAGKIFVETALESLSSSELQLNHNHPFKGGFLTRSKGNPDRNVHALQLEMSKDLYMSENETVYDPKGAEGLKRLLESTFKSIIARLSKENI